MFLLIGKSKTDLEAELLKGFVEQWMIDSLESELSEDIKQIKEEFPNIMVKKMMRFQIDYFFVVARRGIGEEGIIKFPTQSS